MEALKSEMYSVSEASKITGMTPPRIMRRIRNSIIKASKVGWVWVIPKEEVEKLRQEIEQEGKEE